MYDELESLCRSISSKQFWPEGWIAVKRELQTDSAPKETLRLTALELLLRPTDLVQRVRSIVLSQEMRGYDLDYSEGNAAQPLEVIMAQTEALARSLGKAAAMDTSALEELLPDLLTSQGRLWSFGCGLAEGSDQPEAIWSRLTNQLIAPEKTEKRVETLCGFINELHKANPLLANVLLDRTVENDGLAPWYPRFEASIPIDKQGVARLMHSLTAGKTPIAAYRSLAWGGATSSISGDDLSQLVTEIAARSNGFDVGLEITAMRIHSYPDKAKCSGDIIDAGRKLLRHIEFSKELDNHDYNLAAVVQACLAGDDSTELTKQICRKLKNAVAKPGFYSFNHGYLLESLLIVQPSATLDEFLGVQEYEHEAGCRIFDYVWSWNKNPLDVVPPEQVVAWCRQDSQVRFPRIAAFITVSRNIDKPGERAWSEAALQLLKDAPDRSAVLKEFVNQLVDIHSWSGSRAAVIEANAKLLDQLIDYPDSRVVDFLLDEKRRIHEVIESERTREDSFDKQRDERFE
ncbi:hypothetical protein AYO50_01315 [Acidobacteria bacterium SCGC AG-212-P17]|nr:hypothetical protein AYO50_01315 [Acidobacteria bacterium SCGC AG-212-P17]